VRGAVCCILNSWFLGLFAAFSFYSSCLEREREAQRGTAVGRPPAAGQLRALSSLTLPGQQQLSKSFLSVVFVLSSHGITRQLTVEFFSAGMC
jgi:hypothetical protein